MNNVDIFNICLAKKLSGGGGGTYESKSVTPDFSNGDVTVSPDEGYDALTSVTIEKDADLIAENIKKDVNVFGVVGTLESGGGGDEVLNAVLFGTLNEYTFSTEQLRKYAFYGYATGNAVVFRFTNVTSLLEYTFATARIGTLIFDKLQTIGASAFRENQGFENLVIKTNSVCSFSVGNVSAVFYSTPFYTNGRGGNLYVPQALIASYQADTSWATILGLNANNQILAIEGSPYENP